MAYFTFNGASSADKGLRIINEVTHESTGYDVERVVVPGRDGELLVSNKRLKAVEKSFPCRLSSRANLTVAQEVISQWLNVEGYKDMTLSWDPDYIYKAAFVETFEVEEVLRQFGKVKLNFLLQPVKYRKDGLTKITLSNGGTVAGKGNVQAQPIITIRGNGEGVLTINGRQTKFKNVQAAITFDMQKKMVYSGSQAAWDKVLRAPQYVMPYLDPGANKISWTGSFTVELVPYWGVKL